MDGARVVSLLRDFSFRTMEAAVFLLFHTHSCWLLPLQLDMTSVPFCDSSMHNFVPWCCRLPSCHQQNHSQQGDHSPDNVKFPDCSRQSSAPLGMLSVTHIMPVLVLNTCMDANMQLTINSFRQLFPDKIFPLTFPWLLVKSLTFPWQLSNYLTFPGVPDKGSPWVKLLQYITFSSTDTITSVSFCPWAEIQIQATENWCCSTDDFTQNLGISDWTCRSRNF